MRPGTSPRADRTGPRPKGILSGAYGACPCPVTGWAQPTSTKVTNTAARHLKQFIGLPPGHPIQRPYPVPAIGSIRLGVIVLDVAQGRDDGPAYHFLGRVGCHRTLSWVPSA